MMLRSRSVQRETEKKPPPGKSYKCKVCDRSFLFRQKLAKHYKSHNVETAAAAGPSSSSKRKKKRLKISKIKIEKLEAIKKEYVRDLHEADTIRVEHNVPVLSPSASPEEAKWEKKSILKVRWDFSNKKVTPKRPQIPSKCDQVELTPGRGAVVPFIQPYPAADDRSVAAREKTHGELPDEELIFECEICNQEFSDLACLYAHAKSHQQKRPFRCKVPDCIFITSREFELAEHTKNQHPPTLAIENAVAGEMGEEELLIQRENQQQCEREIRTEFVAATSESASESSTESSSPTPNTSLLEQGSATKSISLQLETDSAVSDTSCPDLRPADGNSKSSKARSYFPKLGAAASESRSPSPQLVYATLESSSKSPESGSSSSPESLHSPENSRISLKSIIIASPESRAAMSKSRRRSSTMSISSSSPKLHDNSSESLQHSPTNFACSYCERAFRSQHALVQHLSSVHPRDRRPFTCNFCDKVLRNAVALEHHIRMHTGEKPYICTICSKSFISCGGLKSHLRVSHSSSTQNTSGGNLYECKICNKSRELKVFQKRNLVFFNDEKELACHYFQVHGLSAVPLSPCRNAATQQESTKDQKQKDQKKKVLTTRRVSLEATQRRLHGCKPCYVRMKELRILTKLSKLSI